MSASDLEAMGLDPLVVRRRVDFLASYAAMAEDELAATTRRDESDELWTIAMDAATAHRDAAQWAIYFDPQRALGHLRQAGRLYLASGQPYGSFLLVVSEPPAETTHHAEASLGLLVDEMSFDEVAVGVDGPSKEPLGRRVRRGRSVPSQQAGYAFLAAAAHVELGRSQRDDLVQVAHQSPHGRSITPVGSLGIPLRTIWACGRALIDGRAGPLLEEMTSIAGRYAETMSRAQSSDFLWRNAASPVDVGDMELVGIAALATQRVGPRLIREELVGELGPIASAPIRAGLDLIAARDG